MTRSIVLALCAALGSAGVASAQAAPSSPVQPVQAPSVQQPPAAPQPPAAVPPQAQSPGAPPQAVPPQPPQQPSAAPPTTQSASEATPAAQATPAARATGAAPPTAPATPDPQPSAAGRDGASVEIEGLTVHPGGLTVEDTVRRSLAVSANAAERQAEIDAANARIRQTIIQFVPKLTLKASYLRTSTVDSELGGALVGARNAGPLTAEDCDMGTCVVDSEGDPVAATPFTFPSVEDNFAVTASLAIPLSDYLLRLSDASAGAKASREAAQFALTAAESKVRTDARVLYYNWLRAHAQSFIAAKAVERSQARLEDAKAGFAVGKLANADVLRIEALVANNVAGLEQAEALRALVGAQLAIIMRDMEGGVYNVGSSLPALDAEELPPDGVRKLTQEALVQRLELRSIDAVVKALSHGEDAIVAGGYPRLDAIGEVTYANPNPRYFPPASEWNASWQVGVVASFNVDAPFAGSAQAAELRAQAAGVRAQRTNLEAAIVNEVVTAQLDVVKARAALKAGEVSLRAFDEAYRVATDLFRVGRGTTSDLVDAEGDLLGAKLQLANARIDLTIAVTRLDYALGRESKAARPQVRETAMR